ncbi:MAG TPA: T9SS type A sorting domain-containing protein, partial [Flavobacteriales bacterium]|nr:T9SS type A sorting domain-containing protein [Flavobacteriales bacterium]
MRAWYSGDTVVGGLAAKRIDQTIIANQPNFPFTEGFVLQQNPLFTHEDGDVVMLWDALEEQYDTLMWFSAVPGDHWTVPLYDGVAHFDVLDTGTTVVEGIPLHYLLIEEPVVMGYVDTLRERIGFDRWYIDPQQTLLVDFTTDVMRCYRDDVIDEYHGPWGNGICDFTLAVHPVEVAAEAIFPNPGTDHFILQQANGSHTVSVFDAVGRCVLAQRTNAQRTLVNTSALTPGIYHVRVDDGATIYRWVKE